MKNYHKDSATVKCSIKHYHIKVNDSINWEFVRCCLTAVGVPDQTAAWVKVSKYSLLSAHFLWPPMGTMRVIFIGSILR